MTKKKILFLLLGIFCAIIFGFALRTQKNNSEENSKNGFENASENSKDANDFPTALNTEMPSHTLFTWGKHGGPALHDADDETTMRGSFVEFVHGSAATGNDDQAVLRFGGVAASEREKNSIRNAESGLLTLTPGTSSENRSVWVWTDLSDEISATGSSAALDFLVSENVKSGAIVRASWANPFVIEIPANLLYVFDGEEEKFAEYIYVFGTLGTHGGATSIEGVQTAGGLRTDVTANIFHAHLKIIETPPFATNISLNIGENETEMRFSWWTPKGEATAAVLQIAPYADLVGGQMPENALTINGDAPFPIPSDAAQYAFDVNRAAAKNLAPSTRFAYRVGDGTPENWSAIFYFDTFEPRAEGQTILLVGDPQMGGAGNLSRQIGKFQNALDVSFEKISNENNSSRRKINFILNTGDNFSPANSVERASAYLAPTQLRNVPVFTTIGNHDTVTLGNDAGDSPLSLLSFMYDWPNHDWLGGDPTHATNYLRGGGNHFFSYGDVLYVSLNTNLNDTSKHRAFLKTAAESFPDAKWRIVLFHQDIFGNGTGHAASMPGSGRQSLLHALTEFEIDLVINGHEHTHSRSHFMRGKPNGTAADIQIELQQRPADFARNLNERLIFDAHPGVFVAPQGIPFVTLASVSDFPKYTSIFPPMPWTAWTDAPAHDNFSQYSLMKIDGDTLSIETFAIPYDPSNWFAPSGEA
ncbi:MAG: metallophosphoesterase, partial [Defluviitaleaceae bacterium]|nr:metallophosphoesterase [Defluviitaleaceae bacterium]